jgi:tungstate transport system substrate-binding protein
MKKFLRLLFLITVTGLVSNVSAEEFLRLATTTSTENSGLLSVLHPPFERKAGVKVHVIAVGTGKALRLAQDGDVDLVLAHAPAAEMEFMEADYGVERQPVMHNDFILLGPPDDPAKVKEATSLADAMLRIHQSGQEFISRGDDSGTHKKELELWQLAGINPQGKWYLSVGQGMGQVLQVADEKLAYTLSDRGTWLAYKNKIELGIVFEKARELENPYHVILVNPQRHPHTKIESAREYAKFITGEEGQKIIREFAVNGQPLFYPDVIR